MANSITAPYGLETNNPLPEVKRYYNLSEAPYVDIPQALSEILEPVRYLGQTVNIDGAEYWWKESTTDGGLIIKTPPITSTSLIVTSTVNEVTINLPEISEVPSLIVNNAYTPTRAEFLAGNTKGNGTAARPFTDTITSWVLGSPPVRTAGSAIQNALDAYVGTGGKGTITDTDPPELLSSIIQIEKGNASYSFTGDFDYLDLKIQLKAGAIIGATPVVGEWLMDFTKFSTTTSHNPSIYFEEGSYIFCQKSGFKIVGGDFPSGSTDKKSLTINGSKTTGLNLVGNLESHILFEVNGGGETYINGNFPNLVVNSFSSTRRGQMFVVKGSGRVYSKTASLYFLTEPNAVTITDTYPPIEIRDNGIITLDNCDIIFNKKTTPSPFIYNQFVLLDDSGYFEAIDSKFIGDSVYFAYSIGALNPSVVRLDVCKMYIDNTTNGGSFADTLSGIWQNIILTNNNMPNTTIDPTTTEILPSSINTIASKVIETLSSYATKAAAKAAGVPKGGAFTKVTNVSAVDLIAGVEYKVTTFGDGALGALNSYFIATGSETGTGVGTLYERDIVA